MNALYEEYLVLYASTLNAGDDYITQLNQLGFKEMMDELNKVQPFEEIISGNYAIETPSFC